MSNTLELLEENWKTWHSCKWLQQLMETVQKNSSICIWSTTLKHVITFEEQLYYWYTNMALFLTYRTLIFTGLVQCSQFNTWLAILFQKCNYTTLKTHQENDNFYQKTSSWSIRMENMWWWSRKLCKKNCTMTFRNVDVHFTMSESVKSDLACFEQKKNPTKNPG